MEFSPKWTLSERMQFIVQVSGALKKSVEVSNVLDADDIDQVDMIQLVAFANTAELERQREKIEQVYQDSLVELYGA